jgi:hypothetical protein
LKTKEFFFHATASAFYAGHGTLFACFQNAHCIAKLVEAVFVDLRELVVRPELQPLQGALPIPIT